MKTLFQIFSLFVFTSTLFATAAFGEGIATLYSSEGVVEVKAAGTDRWNHASLNDSLSSGDTIRTRSHSRAGIIFSGGVSVRLKSNSILEIKDPDNDEQLYLKQGGAHFFSRSKRKFPGVKTPVVSAAVRGTEFVVEAGRGSTTLSLIEGSLLAENSEGKVILLPGELALVKSGAPPLKGMMINPLDAVQWTLRFPPVGKAENDPRLKAASAALSYGDVREAQVILSGIKDSAGNPALKAGVLALKSVISLYKNDKENAEKLLSQADGIKSDSLAVVLARSFLAQAGFDTDSALKEAKKAAALSPQDPFVEARLAEVYLSLGKVNQAREAVERALSSSPDDAYARTVSGFISLIGNEPEDAEHSFLSAISLDSSSGLAFLGLGLSKINQGRLSEGRADLIKAAALEPNMSLYRSYLGKAFFEEEDEDLALNEYERAIALDPKDPTPYLYRAYSHLSANRLAAALDDVEKSIELNGNRAVYRSKLLLDKDAAVRSAGLAEVFTALGFSRAAQVEAAKSLGKNYGNYSAHRLLGDSYTSVFRNDARISERKTADLLSPLSFNLTQNPGGDASINEYNALFERPDIRYELDFTGANVGERVVPGANISGRTQRFGYFFGYDPAFGGGRRNENYLHEERVRGVGQYQFSYKDRLILDGSYKYFKDVDEGADLDNVRFENLDLSLGYSRRINESSSLISQFSYRDGRDKMRGFDKRPVDVSLTSLGAVDKFEDTLFLDQLFRDVVRDFRLSSQYLFDTDLLSVVAGGQLYYSSPRREEESIIVDDDEGLFSGLRKPFVNSAENSVHSGDLYLYGTLHPASWIDVTAGVSYTDLKLEAVEIAPFIDETLSDSSWSPKIGAGIYPVSGLTLRGAYFEGIRKAALEDTASLEPTLVGGLNQRFTDFSGTKARNLSFAVDYKVPGSTYLGAEYLRRRLSENGAVSKSSFTVDFDTLSESIESVLAFRGRDHQDQNFVSAYLYQIFCRRFSGTVDYDWSKFELTDPGELQDVETHKTALALRYFDPSGVFGFLKGTWRRQDLTDSFFFEDGVSDFWVFDAGMGYRFPKRHGSVVLQAVNIFDRDFTYDQSFGTEAFIAPQIGGELAVSFNF